MPTRQDGGLGAWTVTAHARSTAREEFGRARVSMRAPESALATLL